jgi:hypothetical protein
LLFFFEQRKKRNNFDKETIKQNSTQSESDSQEFFFLAAHIKTINLNKKVFQFELLFLVAFSHKKTLNNVEKGKGCYKLSVIEPLIWKALEDEAVSFQL